MLSVRSLFIFAITTQFCCNLWYRPTIDNFAFYAPAACAAVAVLRFLPCPSRRLYRGFCPVSYLFLSLCQNRLNGFWWHSREVITTVNRLKYYIWAKLERGQGAARIRQNIRIDINRCCRDVKLMLANEFTNFTAQSDRCDHGHNSRYFKDCTCKFHINILRIL